MDCPSDVATYIHRVGRTARYNAGGRAVLFVEPSEIKMIDKLKEAKIPIIAKLVIFYRMVVHVSLCAYFDTGCSDSMCYNIA